MEDVHVVILTHLPDESPGVSDAAADEMSTKMLVLPPAAKVTYVGAEAL
jgi:hypothetical protein